MKPVTRLSCSSLTSGPISVWGSSPGPTRICAAMPATPETTSSNWRSWTYRREPAQQHWPWLKKIAFAAPGNRDLEIRVGQHDVRRLAAELERDLLQVAGCGAQDQLADLGRAGERDLVDVGVGRERGAGGLAEPRDDVQHAGREARLEG